TVLFSLPQDELPRVMRELQAGPMTVEAWSRDGSQKLSTGQLALVDNQINAATATLQLKAVFPNPQRLLWPNQFVKARLLLTTRKVAPRQAGQPARTQREGEGPRADSPRSTPRGPRP